MKNPGIYILTSPSRKQYIGKDSNLPNRAKEHLRGNTPTCRAIHDAIQKYGRDAFSVEIIRYPGISEEALKAVERWWIQRLQTLSPSGYNLTEGGEGALNPAPETRQKMRKHNYERVANGTHPFLGGDIARRTQRKRVADGTHHWLGSESNKQRVEAGTHNFLGENNPMKRLSKQGRHPWMGENSPNHKRVKEGTHNFLGGELNKKRVKEGTHNLLGENNPSHKRVADGTHNLLGENNPSHKRVEDGTHNLLGENNPIHKRVADGTHQRIVSETQKKRVEDGTHNLLGENNPMRKLSKEGMHPSTRKRQKAEWCYIIALSRFWYEIHDYTLKRRAEFLSKDIPDTSNAEQEYLF